MLRPERLTAISGAAPDGRSVNGTIRDVIFQGSEIRLLVDLPDGTEVVAKVESDDDLPPLEPGTPITLGWAPDAPYMLRGRSVVVGRDEHRRRRGTGGARRQGGRRRHRRLRDGGDADRQFGRRALIVGGSVAAAAAVVGGVLAVTGDGGGNDVGGGGGRRWRSVAAAIGTGEQRGADPQLAGVHRSLRGRRGRHGRAVHRRHRHRRDYSEDLQRQQRGLRPRSCSR